LALDGFFDGVGFFFELAFAAFFAVFFDAFGLPPTKMIIVSSFRFLDANRSPLRLKTLYPP
jgi:hypothetical protein